MFFLQLQTIIDNLAEGQTTTLIQNLYELPTTLSFNDYQVSLLFYRLKQAGLWIEMAAYLTHIETGITRVHMMDLYDTMSDDDIHQQPAAAAAIKQPVSNYVNTGTIFKNIKKPRTTSPVYKKAFTEYLNEWFTKQGNQAIPFTLTELTSTYKQWYTERGEFWKPTLGSIPASIGRNTVSNILRELNIDEFTNYPGHERSFRLFRKNNQPPKSIAAAAVATAAAAAAKTVAAASSSSSSSSDDEDEDEVENEADGSDNYDEEDSFIVDNDRVDYASDASIDEQMHLEMTSKPIFKKSAIKRKATEKNPFIDCEADDETDDDDDDD